jgi:hypothetical protein
VKPLSKFLLLSANGFVTLYYWISYQNGLSAERTLVYLFFSLIGINLALFFGQTPRSAGPDENNLAEILVGLRENRDSAGFSPDSAEENVPGNIHEGVYERAGDERFRLHPRATVK